MSDAHYNKAKRKIALWKKEPWTFVREGFGVEPTWQQMQLFESLVDKDGPKGIAIRSGHGTGKSAGLSLALLWFLLTRPGAKILVTAPSRRQLRDILWAEISMWARKALPVIQDMLDIHAEVIRVQGRADWFARAVSINTAGTAEEQSESLAGYHHEHFMCIVDEGSGVNDPVFQPVEGFLTRPDNWVLITSNPTRASGYFWRLFNEDSFGEGWKLLHWNSEESPLVDPNWVKRMEKKYGRESDTYRIRVLGEFPLIGSQELVPIEWIRRSINPALCEDYVLDKGVQKCYWGLDVARFGSDEMTLVRRAEKYVYRVDGVRKMDTIRGADWALSLYHEAKLKPTQIFVDVSGGVGVGIADILRSQLPLGCVVDVNVSIKAFDTRFFFQARDEMWWKLRKAFENRTIEILNDESLIRQIASIRYSQMEGSGKTKIEAKKVMRGRGLPSPDRADSLAMTYFYEKEPGSLAAKIGQIKRRHAKNWRVA